MTHDRPPPCDGSAAWLVEDMSTTSRPGVTHTPGERQANREAIIRAKLTCLAWCQRRAECMKGELEFSPDDQYFVYGGYSGTERQRFLAKGPLPVPAEALGGAYRSDADTRTAEFLDHHLTLDECAERWGTTPSYAEKVLKYSIWNLRVEQGDPWVMLHGDEVSSRDIDATVKEATPAPRAA